MREKYEAALGEISDAIEDYCANGNQKYYKRLDQAQDTIMQLIENHFDNPPLKFEELEEGMWVWYKPLKQWKKIYRMNPDRVCFQWIEFDDGYVVDFEENMFYRKQVEE